MIAAVDGSHARIIGINESTLQANREGIFGTLFPESRKTATIAGADFLPNVETVVDLAPDLRSTGPSNRTFWPRWSVRVNPAAPAFISCRGSREEQAPRAPAPARAAAPAPSPRRTVRRGAESIIPSGGVRGCGAPVAAVLQGRRVRSGRASRLSERAGRGGPGRRGEGMARLRGEALPG